MVNRYFSFLVALFFASASSAQFSCPPNIDFEQGNYSNWLFYTGTCCPINTATLSGPLANRHVLTSGSGVDPYGGFPVVAPGGGNYSLRLGNSNIGAEAERARYYVHVPVGVNNYALIYRYAVVFENPPHELAHQPRFEVNAYDSATGAPLPCGQYSYVASSGLPGFQLSSNGYQVWYKPWSTASIDLSGLGGKTIAVDFASGDCLLGGHFGYGYLDLSCSLFEITSVNCSGAPTTTLNAPPGFQIYQWYNAGFSPVGTGQSVVIPTPSATTQYHVVLTPYAGYGCPDTLTTTVSVSSLTLQVTNDTFVCGGGSVQLQANATSTSSTINYSWSPAAGLSCTNCTSPIATVNTATTYYVTVSDGNGCSKTDSVRIEVGPSAAVTKQDVLCYNDATGSATIQVSGGKSPYSYNWNTAPAQTTATATGLSAGNYMGIVTDANGCADTVTATITQPSALVVTANATDVSCYGAGNGSANAMAAGGVSPYSYQWNTTPVQTGSSASNLIAGSYVVTVTDQHNCVSTDTVLVNQPASLAAQISSTNHVSCNGGANGSATVVVSGGKTPYSYSWNTTPVQTTATATGLAAGTYTVTVTDSAGCTDTAMVTITQPSALTATGTSTPAGCFGMNTGSASVNVSGGTTPYTYSWNTTPTQTTASVTNLSGGSYSVVVTDSNGCSTTATTTVHQPAAALSTTASVTDVSCYGGNNGGATVNVSGGTAPYFYQWNTTPVQTTATASGLSAGSYLVTVTDSNNCTDTAMVTIHQPDSIALNFTATHVSCHGLSNGSASAILSGGTSPYAYSWNTTPVQTGATANNLTAGVYNLTVTDNNSCIKNGTVTITEPTALAVSISNVVNVNCNGGTNGAATTTASGGTSPYTYSWNTTPVQNTATATGLSAGTYVVTVTDAHGCNAYDTVVITQPQALAAIATGTDVNCFGAATGTANVQVSGGTLPYSYSWNTQPAQNTTSATGLVAGTYSVTVSDGGGCSTTVSATINQPTVLNASISNVVNVACGGNTGSATVVATGGTTPYTYVWNTSPQQTQATASNLGAGTYVVTVTDNNGCTDTVTATITQPSNLAVITTSTDVNCYGEATGTANAVVTGGTAPYTYLWSNAYNGPGMTNLTAGSYQITVTDSNGCSVSTSVNISQPSAPLSASLTPTNILCNGGIGSATAVVNGGTAPYSYSWNTIPAQHTATAGNLPAGNYTLTITDDKGCAYSDSVTITQPAQLSVIPGAISYVSCYGRNDGSASVVVTGGIAPYNYNWNTTPVQTSATVSGLAAGNYLVTVTDANGCSDTVSVNIQQPTQLTVAPSSTSDPLCYGGTDGSAAVQTSGGTAPYTYLWSTSPVQNGAAAGNLSAGNYSVVVSDQNGCTDTAQVVIHQPAELTVGVTVSPLFCLGGSSGSATATVNGGTTPYSYSWNTTPAQTTATATNLTTGAYQLTVTDGHGCQVIDTAHIAPPSSPLTATAGNIVPVSCFGGSNGSATVNVTGGSAPYNYSWNTTPVQTTATATGLSAGNYTVIVSDQYGCADTVSFVVTQPASGVVASSGVVQPVSCAGGSNGSASVTVAGGTIPFTYSWNPAVSTGSSANNLSAGNYVVTVTDNNGCSDTATITITQPSALAASTQITDVNCNGGSDGSITATISGGTVPYSYSWLGGSSASNVLSGIGQGTYTLIVTDALGCVDSFATTVNEPAALASTISVITPFCSGAASGSATATVNGGTSPYSYSWNTTPVQTTATATNLTTGVYQLTVTDAHGCQVTDTAHIAPPSSPLTATAGNVVPVSCFGGSNGSATVNVTGGSAPYNYSWNTTPVQTTATATGLSAGNYTVIVSDQYGCADTVSFVVTQPSSGVVASSGVIQPVSCADGSNGSASVTVAGGTIPFTYSWNPAVSTSSSANNLSAGNYVVTVSDNNGCSDTAMITIPQPSSIAATTQVTDVNCNGGTNGSISATVTGGTAPYSYSWLGGSSASNVLSGIPQGVYTLVVTDALGCVDSFSATVNEPSALISNISVVSPFCSGAASGTATAIVNGGTPPYVYSWNTNPAQTGATALNLGTGVYLVNIQDQNGCSRVDTAVIAPPAAPLHATMGLVQMPTCFGAVNGSATVTVTGGSAPYNYSWNTIPVQTTATATGLAAGTYTVYVSDANGCADTVSVTLTQPASGISVTVDSLSHLRCYNDNTGSVSVTASGGTLPYTYTWNTVPAQIGSVATGLGSGTYTVTVTDGNGCAVNQSVTLNQPTALNASIAISSPVTCHGAGNGSLTASATGGTAPYSYSWNTVPVQTTATAGGLGAGSYTVYVSDVNGCIDTVQLVLTEPSALTATLTTQPILCFGGTGGATVVAGGGTAPYSYSWNTNPVQSTGTLSGVGAGTYVVTISDSLNCQRQDTVALSQPVSGVQLQIDSIATVSCFGGSDGGVWTSVTGGTAPYSYLWTPGSSQTAVLTGVTAGNYVLIATDINGCSDTAVAVVGEHAPLVISAQGVKGSCPGLSEGAAGVTVNGGTAPYRYLWSTVPAQSTPTVSGLPAGSYTVTVTDSLNCSNSTTITIQSFPKAVISAGSDTVLCPGETVRLQATGGMSYHWYPEEEVSCASCADPEVSPKQTIEFVLTGIDGNGCRDTDRVKVSVLERGSVSVGEDISICEGESAELSAYGGDSYLWLPSGTVSDPEISHPRAFPGGTTTYQVLIRQNRCFTDTLRQTVHVHPLPTIDLGPDIKGAAGSLVRLSAQTTNANSISWSPGDGLSCTDCYEPELILEKNVQYRATVTSAAGCVAYDDITISVGCDNSVLFMPNTFTPNGDGNNDTYYPVGRGIRRVLRFEIYSRWGELMYSVRNASVTETSGWDGTYRGERLNPDVFVYLVEVECLNGDTIQAKGDISLIR